MSKIDRLRQRLAVIKKEKLFGGKTEKQMRDLLKTPEGKKAFKLTGIDTSVYSEALNTPKGFKKNVKQLKEETEDVKKFGDKFIHSDQRGSSSWQATDLFPSKKHKSKVVPAFGRGKNYIAIENLSADVPPKVFSDTGKKNRMYTKGIEKMRGLNYPKTKGLKRIPPSIVTGSGELGQTPYSALAEQEFDRSKDKNYKPTGRADAGGVKDIDILRRNITQQNAIRWSKLRQRIAQVRLAYAGPPQDVINAFRNKKALKFREKPKGRSKEYSFQTDGETLYQSQYPIAKHTKRGIKFSYQKHLSSTTAQAGRMLGINTFTKGGKTYINGQEMNPDSYDYVEVPFKDIQKGTTKVNPNAKVRPMTPEQRQKIKDQDYFSTKARREFKDPETGEVYDQVVIQPKDQEEINRVTGLNTPIPEETFASDIHHGIPVEKYPELIRSTAGATPLSKKSHREVHFPEMSVKNPINKLTRKKLKNARLKIARIRMAAAAPGIRMNPQHGRTIADAFDTMQHTPNSPKVKASYGAFINETNDQARALQKSGVKFESQYRDKAQHPYGGKSKALHDDIEKNKHIFYRKSENDYKGFEDNPMFKLTDIRNSKGHRMRANDVFRAVHDINGHNLAGRAGFSSRGEQRAFLQHKKMYSPLASKALFTETAAQANWTNYSKKHGAKNQYFQKINKMGNLKFPQQKAGLLPDDIIGGNWHQRLGKQRNISRGVPRIAMGDLTKNLMQKAKANPLFLTKRTPVGYVYDEDNNIFLDATKRAHAKAIREKHGKEGEWLGINSVTDTNFGKDPVLRDQVGLRQIERELNDIEDIQKDRPILGGYEDSIEASYPVIGDEKTILSRLNKNQESSLGIDPEGTAFLLYPDGTRKQITKD